MVSPRKENSWMVDILLKILGVPQQFPMVKRSSFLSNDLGDLGSDLLLWLKSVLKISDYWLRRVRGRCQNEGRQGRSTWWGVPKLIPENPFIAWLACCIRLLLGRLLPHRKCLLSCGWIVFGFDFSVISAFSCHDISNLTHDLNSEPTFRKVYWKSS